MIPIDETHTLIKNNIKLLHQHITDVLSLFNVINSKKIAVREKQQILCCIKSVLTIS